MSYVLMSDSCCDLLAEEYRALDLQFVPLTVHFSGREFADDGWVSCSIDDFYRQMRAGETGTTSQVSPETFLTAFRKYAAAGQSVLYLGFSSGLSGTYESAAHARAIVAAEYPSLRFDALDTRCASGGQGLLLHMAAHMRLAGKPQEEVLAFARDASIRMQHWVTVGNLTHLRKGGRISAASAFLGTIIDIKPIIYVNEQGKLIPVEKVKGRKRAMRRVFEHFMEQKDLSDSPVWFIHSDCAADAREMEGWVKQACPGRPTHIGSLGPVIGSHTGPDTVAVFFLGKSRMVD